MIVVTGATGNVGRALVERLAAEGRPVRALTRDPQRAALPPGAEVVRFAPGRPAALFEGATKLFLYIHAVGDKPPAFLAAARAAGVRQVVLLSSGIIQEGADESHPIHVKHATAERQIRASGLAWTFLRPNAFAANAFRWAPQIRAGDRVHGVFADGLGAPIHEDDIAAVAERALLDDGHEGTVHRLTGPGAMSNAGQVAAIERAVGRELELVEVPPEITDAVERITGTPARSFARWAEDHADDFRN